ncbi:class I tRNA ligase family protein [Patescibacteria group bacterium]|nr:class I tRNA ligase family protein [Patescibacteria group bacterium]
MEVNFPEREEQILKKWKTERVFDKSVARRKKSPRFVFYEGPPTANGRPGIHHVLSRAYKDVVLRYKTMRGFSVPRRAGWDTHGLPVELQVEKKLGLKSKKDIEKYGIAKFNEACRKSVWEYKKDWEQLTERVGFWLDMDKAYVTYDVSYMETLWQIIARWFKEGRLYKDYKVVPYCPRCGTPLSSHELGLGYKTVIENSVFVKFPIAQFPFPNKSNSKTYFLAWTTTPWTLPGNAALAVGPDVSYILAKKGDEQYILARGLAGKVLGEYEEVRQFTGKELVGATYEPLFSFKQPEKGKRAWEVVPANFVSTEEGTGIVHTAVAYGVDDFELGKQQNLAMFHLVDEQGKFTKEVVPWKEMFVKDADPGIIKELERRGLLFREESVEHEYPHCWRCSTPLLYYAKESWFVDMQKVKKELAKNNDAVNWIPSHLKKGRMGEWLREVKDWTFSRERYWGTPLPMWECISCGAQKAIGSIRELREQNPGRNQYFVLRHAHSERQVKDIASSYPEPKPLKLTLKGRKEALKAAWELKSKRIDLIFSSDLLRTKETADIVGKELGIEVRFDPRLRELDTGTFNGKPVQELGAFFRQKGETPLAHYLRRFTAKPPKGENWKDAQERTYALLRDLEKEYEGKRILFVSHELPLTLLQGMAKGMSREEIIHLRENRIEPGEWRELPFALLPYNKDMELDLHRPFVDEIRFPCRECKNGTMERVKDVVDVWFDSGAMPYAQAHWPFEGPKNAERKPPKEFPADYIAEGVDQTRGWFYTLLATSTLLELGPAYKNVISLGHVLDEKGEKMSKSKGNIVSPWSMLAKYGADALRWYFFTVNAPGDSKLFAENDIQQAQRRLLLILYNSLVFFETYRARKARPSRHVLDRWILSRLHRVVKEATSLMDEYRITEASRLLEEFAVNDLSLWYIRRSRRRFQNPESGKEHEEATHTLRLVLGEAAKLFAPFLPFLAEELWEKTGGKGSVHFEDWPKGAKPQEKLENQMKDIRRLASRALAVRAEKGLKVRQPLASLKIRAKKGSFSSEFLSLLAQETNVKEVQEVASLKSEVELDTRLTPALKEEGMIRELLRSIQDMRKEAGYKPANRILLSYAGTPDIQGLFSRQEKAIKKAGGIVELREGGRSKRAFDVERTVALDGGKLWLGMRKI